MGSLGDLHPFIALGLALRARGASVVLACAAEYGAKVATAGLEFRPIRPSFADMERSLGMDRAALTRAVQRSPGFLIRRLIVPGVRVSHEDMLAATADADLVLTSSLCIGARWAAERRGIPWIGIVLQPFMFLSAFDPPVLPGAAWSAAVMRRLGPAAAGPVLRVAKRLVDGLVRPVYALRSELGFPPLRQSPLFEGQFSAEGAIGLYSTLLGDVRSDYPRPTLLAGFTLFDSDDGGCARLAPALEDFLAAGAPPLVFTLGSLLVNDPGSFYRESAAAARLAGQRAVLLVGEDALAAHAHLRSDGVHVAAYAPHSLLFPRAAAIVHHGGIGTMAQALRAGRPQLVVPHFADQPDNAARAVRLGLARSLTPRRYRARAVARELARLARGEYRTRAAAAGGRLRGEDGAARAAAEILNRLESRAVRSPPSDHGVFR